MTKRANETGFLTVVSPETAPHRLPLPSIILASISTVPFSVNADPRPELNKGSDSNSRTYIKSFTQIHYNLMYRSKLLMTYRSVFGVGLAIRGYVVTH